MTISIRPARPDDALFLAKLIDIAGEGIPAWLWSRQSAPGQTPLEIGQARAARETGGFSYRNAAVAVEDGAPVGMLLSYRIEAAPDDDPDDLPAPIAPFVALEARSVGTWYVNALAVSPGHRGRGIGRALLDFAETLAREAGVPSMSIQVYGQNTSAVRLYVDKGYVERARAPVREHPCQPYYTGDVVLLLKELAA